jgi:two-component system sensor histidine kinase BasS
MMDSVSQLQLARVGQSFSAGSYQHVKLLEDVILPSYDELSTMLDQRKQTLLCHKARRTLSCLGCYAVRMLLRNLVENAHRYSPEGTILRLA